MRFLDRMEVKPSQALLLLPMMQLYSSQIRLQTYNVKYSKRITINYFVV